MKLPVSGFTTHELASENARSLYISKLNSTVDVDVLDSEREYQSRAAGLRAGFSLLRLPDPISFTIFQGLTRELYALALLYRRLHYLALPVFLHQQGTLLLSGEIWYTFESGLEVKSV